MSVIYTLSIACIAGRHLTGPYRFVADVAADATLDSLASLILANVDFDGDHLSDFYLANGPRGKRASLTANGDWDGDTTWALRLSDLFPLERHKKLYYAYDMGASWCFEITRKGRQSAALPGQDYPRIVSEAGPKPKEYGADDDADEG